MVLELILNFESLRAKNSLNSSLNSNSMIKVFPKYSNLFIDSILINQ